MHYIAVMEISLYVYICTNYIPEHNTCNDRINGWDMKQSRSKEQIAVIRFHLNGL